MVKVPSSRLQQCLGPFTMFLVERSSESGFSRDLSNHVFRSPQFRKYVAYEGHTFFWKCWKFNVDFRNAEKNWETVFCFYDNSIWSGWVSLSLLTRKYLSSAGNMLKKILKILHRTKIGFSQLNCFHSHQWIR